MMKRKIGFIGAGYMGEAIIRGALKAGFASPEQIFASDVNIEKLELLKKEAGIQVLTDNKRLVESADVVVFAVKPQMIRAVAGEIKDNLGGKLIISIAAGMPIQLFKDILGADKRIIRVMPNLPLVVGEGMTAICFQEGMPKEDAEFAKSLFGNIGKVEVLDEKYLGDVVSLTASSPAYVFMMIEAMANAAVRIGIPMSQACRIAAQTVLGTASLLLREGVGNETLKAELLRTACTDGEIINGNRIREALSNAMEACNIKTGMMNKN